MKILTHIYHYIVLVFILLGVSVMFMFYLQPVVFAEPAALPEGQLTGWGWTDTFGWISLNCVNVYAGENDAQLTRHCDTPDYFPYGVELDIDTGVMGGFAWSNNAGWIDFSPTVGAASIGSLPTISGEDVYAYTVRMDVDTGYLSGWAVAPFNDNDPNNNAWIRFRAGENCNTVNPDETNYCVRLNENGYLAGWAWSGGEDGLGWIRFDEAFSGGPYLQTKYSDIYSERKITGARAPEGLYNSTYCVLTKLDYDPVNSVATKDNITLTSSQACLVGNVDFEFPDPDKDYTTSIVRIDIDALREAAVADSQYYDVGDQTPYIIDELPNNDSLDDLVYYFVGDIETDIDFYINNPLSFSDAINTHGAGTIVINGDLYINQNISYGSGTPNSLSKIASVAWIVLGDVYVDPSVTEVVGTFVVLGNGTDSGKFYTGEYDYNAETKTYDEEPCQLEFSGMIVAREIVLERAFFESLAPAEIFEYDGRVLLNTPPGLGNFVGYLPEWSH